MDESSFGVHQIKLVIQASPRFSDGGGVAQHAHGTLHFSKIATRNSSRWLVVDSDFETGWTPINKLNENNRSYKVD